MPKCPFLIRCVAAFEEADDELEELVGGITDEQAAWRAGPGRWSIVECIEHLNRTGGGYLMRMERAVERARERGLAGAQPYRRKTFLGSMILRVLEPGAGRKFPAPRVYRPRREPLALAEVAAELRRQLRRLIELADLADGLDLGRMLFATPVAPWPRLTVAEAFEIHRLHIPRHLAQARAVKEAPGYPA